MDVIEGVFDEDEIKSYIERFKRNLDEIMEFQEYAAKVQYAAYEALLEEGFGEDQALILCQNTLLYDW